LTTSIADDWLGKRWMMAFKALRFNYIVAAVLRNDPAVTTVSHGRSITDEGCIALCRALEVNSRVVCWQVVDESDSFGYGYSAAAISQMLQRNTSLIKLDLRSEIIFLK
jgi:hypothetical protein